MKKSSINTILCNNGIVRTFKAVAEGSAGSCLKALGGGAAVASANRLRTSPAPTATDSREPQDDVDNADIADT